MAGNAATSGRVHRIGRNTVRLSVNAAYHGSTSDGLASIEAEIEQAIEWLERAMAWEIVGEVAYQLDDDLPLAEAKAIWGQLIISLAGIQNAKRLLERLGERYGG